MKRRKFIQQCFDCSMATMVGSLLLESGPAYSREIESAKEKENEPVKNDLVQQMVPSQIMKLLKFIEANFDEPIREKIFGNLGYECLYSRGLDKWVQSFKPNLDSFFDRVNTGQSKYWESLEYDKENSKIRVTSRKFVSCVCAYAQCPEPPKSLCLYCCKRFQKALFETLLDKKVEVKIDSSVLLNGERCCTTINIIT
jgi:hypothetical protein